MCSKLYRSQNVIQKRNFKMQISTIIKEGIYLQGNCRILKN